MRAEISSTRVVLSMPRQDLRNHGTSPHNEVMDYSSMADDVLEFCAKKGLKDISLLGHSMQVVVITQMQFVTALTVE